MNGFKKVSDTLVAAIKTAAPTFDGGGIAVPSRGNVFLMLFDGQAGGDFQRIGLDDRNGEWFYIRLRTGEIEEIKMKGGGACSNDSLVTAKCRLVMQSSILNPADLVEHFLPALRAFKSKVISTAIARGAVTPKSYNIDFASVVKEELSEEENKPENDAPTGWEGARFVARIDFDLTYVLDCSQINCDC